MRRAEHEGKPPAIAAKHYDPDNRANQRANDGHRKAGAPKAPTKGGHGVEIASVDKDDSDDNEIASTAPSLGGRCCPGQSRRETRRRRCGDAPGQRRRGSSRIGPRS
jgi:hypothetical protein